MPQVMHLYLDESGTRHPDHSPGKRAAHDRDWFALGGVLLKQEDEYTARQHHALFMENWGLDPDVDLLHSTEIRNKTGRFTWLGALTQAEHDRSARPRSRCWSSAPPSTPKVLAIASRIHRLRSDRYWNRSRQEHASHDPPRRGGGFLTTTFSAAS
jgi:hypothetical protein